MTRESCGSRRKSTAPALQRAKNRHLECLVLNYQDQLLIKRLLGLR